ncbi:transglutaminase domain-containing protein [Paenibacillus sp. UNC499MF]|uniref:transglutaminase domain-containing protein n=1 Tax=Paenibacillus sp. UNC499MF TaxID=1502751 RepID=UPI0008A05D6F|nr:transglutaminase domain-containing protein [Paenibacillus sp. UNC499MF]SEF93011.1 Transglutaminase-like superfamily protein [Paenibacillus sp. UNC499MF]
MNANTNRNIKPFENRSLGDRREEDENRQEDGNRREDENGQEVGNRQEKGSHQEGENRQEVGNLQEEENRLEEATRKFDGNHHQNGNRQADADRNKGGADRPNDRVNRDGREQTAPVSQKAVFSLDAETLAEVQRKFNIKRELAGAKEDELFGVFRQELTEEEAWALKFLIAYMPLNDLADYDGALFLSHVRTTLDIRAKLPWGRRVPDHLFLHFVLPLRVNSENLEDCRGVLYGELAERTRHLTMEKAILETNYWCHEKATYVGSDLRTISPLTMLRSAQGRCGEESTLAVSALRSIGIPARQCYTPRWAHCDDNHAWVEAWADGQWHFIGACEPEPALDRGWFDAPARRAMLVNTRVHANYPGPEPVTLAEEWLTEINLLETYAPVRTVTVAVKDEEDRPVEGARVLFQVYNMAEMYPIAVLETDSEGLAVFRTGWGDLLVRAVKDGLWGEEKLSAAGSSSQVLTIRNAPTPAGTQDVDMVPPPEREGEARTDVSGEMLELHREREQEGTAVRKNFEDTFLGEEDAAKLAGELGLPPERVWSVLRKARGNSREIRDFLRERTAAWGVWPLRLLESMRDKDMLDTFRPTLDDHLLHALKWADSCGEDVFVPYILCPRVHFEMIGPYRQLFEEAFTEEEAEAYRKDPTELVRRFAAEFEVRDDLTNLPGRATAAGSFALKKGDRLSLDILLVAVCRSLGIPARLHPNNQKPEYMRDGEWTSAGWHEENTAQKGKLLLIPRPVGPGEPDAWSVPGTAGESAAAPASEAAYFQNLTLARLEDGLYRTIVFPYGKSDLYGVPIELEAGSYRMTTGTRLKDGTALVRFRYLDVNPGRQTELAPDFRTASSAVPVLGSVDGRTLFGSLEADGRARTLEELADGRAVLAAWIEPEREPSKHLIRELTELADSFAKADAAVIMVVGGDERTVSFDPAGYGGLPAGTRFVRDDGYVSLDEFAAKRPLPDAGFPHVFVVDRKGQIRHTQSGYKVGSAREALQIFGNLCEND